MKKTLLLALGLASAVSAFAAEYYVKPGIKATGRDGSSWEQAITMYDIFENEQTFKKKTADSKYKHGDIFYLAGGTYYNQVSATGATGDADERVRIYRGYTFIGGCDPKKGPVTELPTYPSATPTIFSGDLNENGVPDEGDLTHLLVVRMGYSSDDDGNPISQNDDWDVWAKYTREHACTIIGVDFTCAYYPSLDSANDASGAFHTTQGAAVLKNCNFYNNRSEGKCGAVHNRGSQLHMIDCNVYNNYANTLGGGVRSTTRSKCYALTVIERCYIGENTVETSGGGGVAFSSGREMWIVNSTIANNTVGYQGGGLVANGSALDDCRALHIINSTIAGNRALTPAPTETRATWHGSQMCLGSDPVAHICNSIIVGPTFDNEPAHTDISLKEVISEANFTDFQSYGGSLIGSVSAYGGHVFFEPPFKWSNDFTGVDHATTFGSNVVTDNGGCTKTIAPLDNISYDLGGYPLYGFEPETFVGDLISAGYVLPFDIDLTVDQTGAQRYDKNDVDNAGDTAPGAFDTYIVRSEGSVQPVIEDKVEALRALGNNCYRLAGANGNVEVVSVTGAKAAAMVKGNTVDLSNLTPGVYVIFTGNKAYKVVR